MFKNSTDFVQLSATLPQTRPRRKHNHITDVKRLISLVAFVVALLATMYLFTLLAAATLIRGGSVTHSEHDSLLATPTVPDYFQTSPQVYAGPTATGRAPFLAQVNPAPFGDVAAFVPNEPLETAIPIMGNRNNSSIFRLMGQLSPYSPGPGFGSNEYPLPPGANISQVHVLHRHGSRYPAGGSPVPAFAATIREITDKGLAQWSGPLSFLRDWRYDLGAEILVARGRQELFDSGVLHYYNYGWLYNTSTKIIARTTTQDRMLKSAEYFMAGFFGLEWTQNATLEVQIEHNLFNTSLAGSSQCPNFLGSKSSGGNNASDIWELVYLTEATKRLRAFTGDYEWTVSDSYNAQTLCPYETVAYGYSPWCELFTFEEWEGFEYSIDLQFYGNNGFGSPTGRGVGIGYVQEFYARLQNHLYDLPQGATNVNYTLDTMNSTFPLNQTLYFDFSHDTNMISVLTAFGLRQFAEDLSATAVLSNRSMVISHVTPFGARIVFEIIRTPRPVRLVRPVSRDAVFEEHYDDGEPTTYIHLLINQRTVPLYTSYPDCGPRDDGWCNLSTFLTQLSSTLEDARYQYSCFEDYTSVPYGGIKDGAPITKRDLQLGYALGGKGSTL